MAEPAVTIPSNSSGLAIVVESGGFNMTGFTAILLLQLQTLTGQGPTISLTLVVSGDGMSGTYTTTGGEFTASGPGLYNAQLKVMAGGTLLYSLSMSEYVQVQAVEG